MLLIGFGHKARQGKNTAAVAVINATPLDSHARIYAYADALRAEVKRALSHPDGIVNRHVLDGTHEADSGYVPLPDWVKLDEHGKPRTLLQWWGTDYRRAQDPNYWVKRLKETLEREQPDVALVTDVRFVNEAEAIHQAGGYLVKVERTTKPDVKVPAHPSENDLDGYQGWDFYIKADSIADCHRQAAAVYRQIVGEHGVSKGFCVGGVWSSAQRGKQNARVRLTAKSRG